MYKYMCLHVYMCLHRCIRIILILLNDLLTQSTTTQEKHGHNMSA